MKHRWVVISFFPEGIYNTSTFDTMEEALSHYESAIKCKNMGSLDRNIRHALVLEGSELPIKGYKPGEYATGSSYWEVK